MKMWKQWMALLMIFCLLMPGALAGSIDLTDDLDEEVGSVTESSAGEDYTISDNGDIILDDDDDLGGDVIFDDDGSTIEITDNEIDDTIDPDKLDINTNLPKPRQEHWLRYAQRPAHTGQHRRRSFQY